MGRQSGTLSTAPSIEQRVRELDWPELGRSLVNYGFAHTPRILSASECEEQIRLYSDDRLFRSRVEMARFRFGEGDYKYFAAPLPATVQELRTAFYPHVAAIANRWMEELGDRQRFPDQLQEFLALCHHNGQKKPTPLLLHYEAGGYNCLHQDLYGEVAFPLQLTCLLSRTGVEFSGGEFLLVENRPRVQSRGEAVVLEQGEAIIFANSERPVAGSRGHYRVTMRHGVSRVRHGRRFSLGVIFHDAK